MKKIILNFLIIALVFSVFNINSFADTQASIQNVEIEVKDKDIILRGTTVGNTDGMTINVSILDMKQNIEYFNQLTIRGNKFNLTLVPMSAVENDRLMLRISGDLIFTKEFIYAKDTLAEKESSNIKIQKLKSLLNSNYKTYTDYSGNLTFQYDVEEIREGNYIVKMKGTNFSRRDSSWVAKQEKRFETFLKMIGDEAFIILKSNVQIQVSDNQGTIKTHRHNVKINTKESSASEIERHLNSKYRTFKDGNRSLNFLYKVEDINYAFNITMMGTNFKQTDSAWKSKSNNNFINFLDDIVDSLKTMTGKDFVFNIYDNQEYFVDSFSYYNDRYEKDFDRNYDYPDLGELNQPSSANISNFFEYGKNAGKVDEKYVVKTFSNGVYNIQLNNSSAVKEVLSKLKSGQQKEVVIEGLGDFQNKTFKIDRQVVSELLRQNAILTLSSDNFHLHLDYSKLKNYSDGIELNIESSTPNSNGYRIIGEPITISLKVGNRTITASENGLMATLSYKLNDTRGVKDIRTLNVFANKNNQWEMQDSKLNREKYGVSFLFKSDGTYAIIDNIKTFDDIDRHWGKQQIELLASKNMIAGKGNNIFDPDGQVTRAEFITMVVRKLNLPLSFNKVFNDADYNDWHFGYVNSGAQHNLLPPTFVGNIEGNKPITREEMAYIVMRTYDFRLDNKKVYPSAIFYKDSNEVSSWAKDNISRATQLKIIQGWNNNFMPKNNATRAESATMLYNLFRAEGIFTE